ncbi:hypothetical protein DF141_26665 [Burkholderia cenocepacia]|nr:hypothetical protein CFB44_09095 [Burkholderia sp. AU31280]RQU68803.1 hypothetical protein DF141_26665 [Burkholderia cenocepacia]RQU89041.1 hypothetical protein DF133_16250 [Burkholderia cenocepacia]RQV66762.1 hypothetical protein DF024_06840 [Burkholderia cenocepacia]RQZ89061.1 hypothetical protein DF058_26840 [Burkholderia cenocepacia]
MKAAIRRQCQSWIAGTWRAPIRVRGDPHGVEPTVASVARAKSSLGLSRSCSAWGCARSGSTSRETAT